MMDSTEKASVESVESSNLDQPFNQQQQQQLLLQQLTDQFPDEVDVTDSQMEAAGLQFEAVQSLLMMSQPEAQPEPETQQPEPEPEPEPEPQLEPQPETEEQPEPQPELNPKPVYQPPITSLFENDEISDSQLNRYMDTSKFSSFI